MQINSDHFVVHKFGGASVKNSEAVRNVGTLLNQNIQGSAVVVVSAMGKTTNELENDSLAGSNHHTISNIKSTPVTLQVSQAEISPLKAGAK